MGIKETKRDHWLATMNLTEGDVMTEDDENSKHFGQEFVMVDFESGTAPDDDYLIGTSKVYLPERLQSDYVDL